MLYLQVLLFAILAFLCQTVNAQKINVESFEEKTFDLEARAEKTKRIDSNNKACALIKVQLTVPHARFEGNKVGDVIENPGEYKVYLVAGSKKLKILVPGYEPCEVSFQNFQIDGVQEQVVYKLVLRPESMAPKTQEIQIHTVPTNASVVLNGEPLTSIGGKASKVLPMGTYKYQVSAEGYELVDGQISHYDTDNPTIVYITLKKSPTVIPPVTSESSNLIGKNETNSADQTTLKDNGPKYKPTSFYIEGKFQAGMMMGVGASIGAYISNFNVEGTLLLGLAESEEIAWRNISQNGNLGYSYTYKPMFYGLKLGYGIAAGNSFRITPQVGVGVSSISGTQVQSGKGTDPDATSCYAVPASVGVRFEYNITRNFGLSVSPEFGFAVTSSDTYTKLSDLSSKIKGFGSGFNARVGIFVSF